MAAEEVTALAGGDGAERVRAHVDAVVEDVDTAVGQLVLVLEVDAEELLVHSCRGKCVIVMTVSGINTISTYWFRKEHNFVNSTFRLQENTIQRMDRGIL